MKKLTAAFISVMLAVICALTFTACNDKPDDEGETIECTGITFRATGYDEGKTWYLERGKTVTVVGTVAPANATVRELEWESDNDDITVEKSDTNKAKVTAYDYGKAKITVKCGKYETEIAVECVAAIKPTEIVVASPAMTVPVSERSLLDYSFVPENTTDKRLSFTVQAIGDASEDAVSVIEENGNYYVQVSALAEVGCQYVLNLSSVADSKVKAGINLTVGAQDVDEMTLRTDKITLSVNDPMYRVTASFKPDTTSYKQVDYTSDNPEVCGVDAIGTLTPLKAGTANITVTNSHKTSLKCVLEVTVTEEESEYVTRLIKKSDVDALQAVDYSIMDFEFDKVAFKAWNKVLSEDSNSASHISDAGWAMWLVGFDTYDDDGVNGGDANAAVYCKVNVPAAAKRMQYVFRAHPTPNDNAKFKILAIDGDYNVTDCTDGWRVTNNTVDMYFDIDVEKFAGTAVTFVVLQDQIGNKATGNYLKVSLMFRRCLFDTDTSERWINDEDYNILNLGN